MEILLLTENILVEEKLQIKIQQLGYEIFVNNSFIHNSDNIFYLSFDICILSRTIPNTKVKKIISTSLHENIGLIRVCDSYLGKESIATFNEVWISQDESLEELKEKLELSKERVDLRKKKKMGEKRPNNLVVNDLHLSMNEQRVFSFLTANENSIISREKICEYVWDKDCNASRKSQLSSLVNRINEKIKASSLSSYEIRTFWGKGYSYSKIHSNQIY